MERHRIRTSIAPVLTRAARALLLCCLPLGLAAGCSSKVDEARIAYADGEGDLEDTERLYREAMKEKGWEEVARDELFDVFMIEGEKQAEAKKYKRAEEAYRKAVELKPDDNDAITKLAESLRDLMRYDEALEVARKGAKVGCRDCRRLMAVLLIRRADGSMQGGQWSAAEQDYAEAYSILPDASVALGLVRARYAQKNVEGAGQALEDSTELIGAQDLQARSQYLELRRAVVLMALENDKVPLADALLDLAPTGVGPETQLGLAMEVAMALRKQGKPDVALSRMMALVDAAAQGKMRITEAQLGELRDKVATLYGARAAKALAEGDVGGAAKDLEEATGIKPDEPMFKLQRALLTAARGDLGKAHSQLKKVDSKAKGYDEVDAILGAMKVYELIDAGKLGAAQNELARAKKNAPELPEVHIATAMVLAQSEVSGLKKADLAEVAKNGLVPYPDGKVTRAGEALSELDWSRQQIRGLGITYPYRAPGSKKRINDLESDIKRYFPYTVKFQGDPTAVFVVENKGSAPLEVNFEGGDVASTAKIAVGAKESFKVPGPAFVRLTYRGTTAALVAEPYTQVQLSL